MDRPPPAPPDDRPPLVKRQGAYLPHWRKEGAVYAVTFRLADSLPQGILRQWHIERAQIVRRANSAGRPLSEYELRRLQDLYDSRTQEWLDQGHGSCALRNPEVARVVADAIRHFEGERHELLAWCIMPNHVHAVVRPLTGWDLSKILLSWKGFSGRRVREMLGTSGQGAFWQKESYDRIVRDADELEEQIRYVLKNPEKARLRDWPWVWSASRSHRHAPP